MPVQKLNQLIRDDLFRRTLQAVQQETGRLVGNCLEFAWHGYQLIKSYPGAPRTIIQAGSASWPRIPPELDDGLINTHFSYVWEEQCEATQLFLGGFKHMMLDAAGEGHFNLPEMHVWLACPESQEIIDFTTSFWPCACKTILGEEWLATRPPDYLWTFAAQLPTGVKYVADRTAIQLVIDILQQQERHYP